MECLIGIQCKDFVLVAADMTTTQSIIVMKSGKYVYYVLYYCHIKFSSLMIRHTYILKHTHINVLRIIYYVKIIFIISCYNIQQYV